MLCRNGFSRPIFGHRLAATHFNQHERNDSRKEQESSVRLRSFLSIYS